MWKKIWMSTVDGSVWDDDEWMRRIEQAEDGAATASAVMALYDSLMSHDDAPSRGVGCLMGRQYRLARLASLPSAPARMLMDMAAVLVDGAGGDGFDDVAFPVVYALGDNPALPSAALDVNKYLKQPNGGVLFDENDGAFGDMMADLAGDPDFGGFDDDDVFGDPDFGGFADGDIFGDYDSGVPVSLREEIDAGGLTVQKADRLIALMDEAFEKAPARGDGERPLYRGVQARVNYSGVHSTGGRLLPLAWVTWWSSRSFCLRPQALLLLTISVIVMVVS